MTPPSIDRSTSIKHRPSTLQAPPYDDAQPNSPWKWLILILIAAAALRFYGLSTPPVDFNPSRQAETAAIALNYYQEGAPFYRPQIDWLGPNGTAEMELPFYAYLVSRMYYLFGAYDWIGRFLSLLAGLGCIVHLWRIGRRIHGDWMALFSAALFAITPLSVFLGRAFQPDMLALYFSLLAFDLLSGEWSEESGENKRVAKIGSSPQTSDSYLNAFGLWLFQWPHRLKGEQWLSAGLALGIALAMAPPAALLLIPATILLIQRNGFDAIRRPTFWGFAILALAPALAWHHHAYHHLYAESGHTIMGYYTRALVDGSLFAHWADPAARTLIVHRLLADHLVYVGFIFAAGGLVQTVGEPGTRWFLLSWLAAGLAILIALPGQPIDPGAFALWAAPPLALLAGHGLGIVSDFTRARFSAPAALWLLAPALLGAAGLYSMITRGWYEHHYPFYHDAIALRDAAPEDALIAVIEEVPRRPELFYFAQRKGWHLHRDGRDWMDDSSWIEAVREQGVSALAVFTETPHNHPLKYLQVHPTGTYIWSHYEIESIGFRHLIARLDKPIRGDHRWPAYHGLRVAAADEAAGAIPEAVTRRPLEAWQECDALLLDFHRTSRSERGLYQAVYNHASERGLAPIRTEGGAWLMAAHERVLPATGVFDAIYSSAWREYDPFPSGVIGVVDEGDYRISVRLTEPPQAEPIVLRALNRQGDALAWRIVSLAQWKQMGTDPRLELSLTLSAPTWLEARADAGGESLSVASVVCAPDVQCLDVDQVYQAESLYTRDAKVVPDPAADRGTALWGYAQSQGRFFCFGPYFRFPDGIYQAVFRVREPRGWSQADMQVGFYENEAIWQRIVNIWMPELGPNYQEFSVEAYLPESFQIETRAFLFPNTEAMLDTIRIRQRQRNAWRFDPRSLITTRLAGDDLIHVSAGGWVFDASMENRHKIWRTQDLVSYADWSEVGGLRIVDRRGGVYDRGGTYIFQIPTEEQSEVLAYALSHDGSLYGALFSDGTAVIRTAESEIKSSVVLQPFPVRDFLLNGDNASGHILFANGAVAAIGETNPVTNSPNFGVDAARSLVRTETGLYVVDCTGVIHSINESPTILTPYYREVDWVADARYNGQGAWLFITREGERIEFRIEQ